MFQTVLCAMDGSEHSRRAADHAAALAAAFDAKLIFLTVTKEIRVTDEVRRYLQMEQLAGEPQCALDECAELAGAKKPQYSSRSLAESSYAQTEFARAEVSWRAARALLRSEVGGAWDAAVAHWRDLVSDPDAVFDAEVELDVSGLAPHVSWGTNPGETSPVSDRVPDPATETDSAKRAKIERSLAYMDLKPGMPLEDIAIDHVFIGSCTNGRLEDMRSAAEVIRGRRIAPTVTAIAVPGSAGVRLQAEAEGLDRIFTDAGFEWRGSGCSMCVAVNDDRLKPGERCASTSNRNFEGRQGQGGRTHLMSPAMAAAAAIAGHLIDVRKLGSSN